LEGQLVDFVKEYVITQETVISARKHQSGKNGDDRKDIGLTMAIKKALIQKYNPEWNVQNKRFSTII